jgi:hypothetical protein
MIFRIKFYYSHNNKMSVSQQSVLGSSQNLIASHVAGCNPPTLKNSIAIPAATTLFFPNVSGAIYTIAVLAAAATICLPHVAIAKGYKMDFVFSGTETKVCTFTSLRSDGTVGGAGNAAVLTGNVFQQGAAIVVTTTLPNPPVAGPIVGVTTGGPAYLSFVNQSLFTVGTTTFPIAGDRISCVCDGANWYISAYSALPNSTIAFAVTA